MRFTSMYNMEKKMLLDVAVKIGLDLQYKYVIV